MKKLILPIIVMVSVTVSSFAQDGASVFKNYKYRFQKYRVLTTNLGLGTNYTNNDNIPLSSSSTNASSNFSFNGSIYFIQNLNTQKLQQFTNASGGLGYRNLKDHSPFTTFSKTKNGSISFDFNQENRFYRGNNFFELNYGLGSRDAYNKSTENGLPSRSNNILAELNISIGAGKGRLEMVGDVAQALFILIDFKKRGIITNYTNDDATALAKAITRIYNTRIIDFRYRMRGQLGMLDSFFTSSGLIDGNKHQSNYFISLLDNWLNNNYVQRFCGSRFSYGISYINTYSNYFKRQTIFNNYLVNQNINNNQTSGLYFSYIKERPISLNWHESFSVNLMGAKSYAYNYYNIIDTNTTTSNTFGNSNINTMLAVDYKISWYPNSRTYLNAGLTGFAWYNVPSQQKNFSAVNFSLMPWVNMFYFVSPKVNFNVSISPMLRFNHLFVNKSSSISSQVPAFNAGLNYYIY